MKIYLTYFINGNIFIINKDMNIYNFDENDRGINNFIKKKKK